MCKQVTSRNAIIPLKLSVSTVSTMFINILCKLRYFPHPFVKVPFLFQISQGSLSRSVIKYVEYLHQLYNIALFCAIVFCGSWFVDETCCFWSLLWPLLVGDDTKYLFLQFSKWLKISNSWWMLIKFFFSFFKICTILCWSPPVKLWKQNSLPWKMIQSTCILRIHDVFIHSYSMGVYFTPQKCTILCKFVSPYFCSKINSKIYCRIVLGQMQ